MHSQNDQSTKTKSQKFRLEIRRKQIQSLFKIKRHNLPQMTPSQQIQKANQNFKQIQQILQNNNHQHMNNLQLTLLLKQLRDINCSQNINHVFINPINVKIIIQVINQINFGQSGGIDRDSLIFLYEIILNISADIQRISHPKNISSSSPIPSFLSNRMIITLEDLQLPTCLQSSNLNLMNLSFQIISNYLTGDHTSKTLYFLISKIHIFPILLKIMVQKKFMQTSQIQNKISDDNDICFRATFMWFCEKILSTTRRFKLQDLHPDFNNFVMYLHQQVMSHFQRHFSGNLQDDSIYTLPINQIFFHLKSLLKTELIFPTEQFIQETYKFFNPTSITYLQFLITLTSLTLHQVPQKFIENLLIQLLESPSSKYSSAIIKVISNSLHNNASNWKKVLDLFTKYSEINVSQRLIDLDFGIITYFIYFLQNQNTQPDISDLIIILICAQGELGIFKQSLEQLVKYETMKKKLINIGFKEQVQEQQNVVETFY